jgi:hypothetical protein
MFNKLKTLKKFDSEIISIEQLFGFIKNNPQKELISKIRSVEYKSLEYNNLKLKVNAITPHGTFNSLKNDGLVNLSNYLYYDIDGFDTEFELNDTKNKLIDTNFVCFISKSVGGRGLSFMIKIDDYIDICEFTNTYNFVRESLINLGFNIDVAANGLVRKMIISYDEELYYNNKVSLSINKVSYLNFLNKLKKVKVSQELKERIHIIPNDTLFEIIPLDILLNDIKIETLYTKEIEGDFTIEEMDYYRIVLPRIILDGTKHKLYIRIINALYYINSKIDKQQIYSYLYHINNMATPKMNEYKLQKLVLNICNHIESTGEIKIKPRIKRLHFNKDSKLTKNQKQSMGAKLGAKIKNNKTLELIEKARLECYEKNQIPTQKIVVELTGLSIATVKRNWNKDYNDLKDIQINKENTNLIERINEEDFFNKEVEKIKFKNIYYVDIDKVTIEDKRLFISKVNELRDLNLEPSEDILYDLNIWTKEKTWYIYSKWIKNNSYKEIDIKD